ncbi:MAG TPA: GNAT family N-acetyltransferase [Anaerolineales bacterium]|nr:GNAT family N-acetyltransferase [Anaerolineales bacterium]
MTLSTTLTWDRTEDLNSAVRDSIIRVCVEAHQEEDFKNLFSYISSGGLHFLAYHGDQLVSHAAVTTRWLQPEDRPLLKTAYVDAVATLPSHQGRGYGSEVMRQLEREIDREYEIACLETERESFYERLGWKVWRGPLAGRSENGLVPTPHQTGIMILRLSRTPALDLDKALSIECQPDRIW